MGRAMHSATFVFYDTIVNFLDKHVPPPPTFLLHAEGFYFTRQALNWPIIMIYR